MVFNPIRDIGELTLVLIVDRKEALNRIRDFMEEIRIIQVWVGFTIRNPNDLKRADGALILMMELLS